MKRMFNEVALTDKIKKSVRNQEPQDPQQPKTKLNKDLIDAHCLTRQRLSPNKAILDYEILKPGTEKTANR